MLSFAYPWLLLLLLAVPLFGRWRWRRKRLAIRYSDLRLLDNIRNGNAGLVRILDTLLPTFSLMAMLLALAGPRWPLPAPITTEGIAMVFVVDVSGSMREVDVEWDDRRISRLDAAKRAFGLFIRGGSGTDGQTLAGRPNDLIGLVTFATYPDTAAPLTPSHDALLRLLELEQPRPLEEAQTNIGDAIALGLNVAGLATQRRSALVLLSDGEHNFPGRDGSKTWTPMLAARRAADVGVPIYCIDAGDNTGNADASIRKAGRETLQEVATMTGGMYFTARDGRRLLEACQAIDTLERRPVSGSRYRRYQELHHLFGLTAVAMIFIAQGVNLTIGRTLP
jgi:Ca-activated chloride channel family protein